MIYLLSFFIPFLIGGGLIYLWQKKQSDPEYFFFLTSWTFFALFVYFALIEAQNHSFYIAIPLVTFLVFLYSYRKEKTKLMNGLLFNLFLATFAVYLGVNAFMIQNPVTYLLLILGVAVAVVVLVFGTISLLLLLYWNSIVMIRRESRSLANMLVPLLAVGLTVFLIYTTYVGNVYYPISILLSILPMTLFYFSIVFLNFLSISILYQFNRPKFRQQFIIVLGAGLINGERVTPLLAKRIDTAIKFYREQARRGHQPPTLIMSGGQGHDEKVSEAFAMQQYALSQGIPVEDILLEDQSTTTFENMKFSSTIIQQLVPTDAKIIFASNNYHIFRAGIFARQAGLKADGIGSKTALYYLPTAFLREFIAIVAMNRKRHFIIVGILSCFFLLLSIFAFFVS